ncbi:hypothetical protein FPSE_09312 [Fusarium pseudograminearum CS3096]|uniref:Uncharacterized protein n=1 Tax=Fusarium pseudograminearum (strain CS3096) TaxID=1028729 RepID=K3VAL3_FUSPC|nr:hypothetical protein FPSE_09312 [Fusarium pseudograminearum CS3096]EKJ70559.1 hypothetical protein FPSE_09312 [Fusarium pseudograminearum CS3096]
MQQDRVKQGTTRGLSVCLCTKTGCSVVTVPADLMPLFNFRSDEFTNIHGSWKPARISKVAWLQGDGGNLWPVAYGLESLDNSAYAHRDSGLAAVDSRWLSRLLVSDYAAIGTAINTMYRLQFAADYMIIRRCDHYRS